MNHWPTLSTDLRKASIASQSSGAAQIAAETDLSNFDSVLTATDNSGYVHYFLDGSYPVGTTHWMDKRVIKTILKHPTEPIFFLHAAIRIGSDVPTKLHPTRVHLPLLHSKPVRNLAQLSSNSKELVKYMLCTQKNMRDTWFGTDPAGGARDLGPKWIQAIEKRQKQFDGMIVVQYTFRTEQDIEESYHAILDLTCLLATGRCTEGLADFLQSGEQMSERVRHSTHPMARA